MKRYFVVRFVQTFVVLWLVLTGLFLLFRLMPGDFTAQMAVAGASPEALEEIRDQWGLNDPLYVQYWSYLVNFVQLDMGESAIYRQDVWQLTKMRIFNTFILVAPAITLTYVLGSVIGTVAGRKRGTNLEKFGIVPVIAAGSFPSFFIAIVFIIVFASWMGLFPTSGMLSPGVSGEYDTWWGPYLSGNFAHHYVLPFAAVICRYLFIPSMIMRTSVIEVMDKGHTQYHRLTGLSSVQRFRHTAKHASLPLITLYPVSMARALGGLVLIETVFNWPGIGWLLVESVLGRDYPVVQFVFFIVAAFVIISNFVVDLVYGTIDPRIRVEE
ncbi:ABC transporter permease [Natronococcus sp. A-GB7]|uniref:ABC transporter permease n=1 Tax=Natronococcus sp. A-GB7 TaxID=3037649 RepID=UPI00241C3A54|nr:ABC transporter permease [Natronococcus sp. A-GB7]MDG5821400.1 ABC transporter permease [Natronococcus sp. A-GB7]